MLAVKVKETADLGEVIELVQKDEKYMASFLKERSVDAFLVQNNIVLAERDRNMLDNFKKSIEKAINDGMKDMASKIAKITNVITPCNGTCW